MEDTITRLLGVYEVEGISDVHLFELHINVPPKEINVSLFFQEDDVLPRNSWQTAYDERFLNEDGTKVIGSFFEQDNLDFQETRVVFFLYFTDFTKSLLTQFGVIKLSEPSPMPDRLAEIIEFIPAD